MKYNNYISFLLCRAGMLLLPALFFSGPGVAQKTFDIYVQHTWKPFYATDTLKQEYRQTYLPRPYCNEWQYHEQEIGGNEWLYVDTEFVQLRVDTAQKIVLRRILKNLGSTHAFQPLLPDFENRLLKSGWQVTQRNAEQVHYFHGKGTDGVLDSATVTVTYRQHSPVNYESRFWMGAEVEYKNLRVIRKAGQTTCIQMPEMADTYRLVDCFNSVSRPYDAYHRLPGQSTDGLSLQQLSPDDAPPTSFRLADSLTTLNLMYVYTQGCLPCLWFMKECTPVLDYLHRYNITFFAVLPAEVAPTIGASPLGKVYRDTDSYLTQKLHINGYPLFLLLDSQGHILDYQAGYKQNGAQDLIKMLQKWTGD